MTVLGLRCLISDMQTQLPISKYEKRVLLITLWSVKDLTQKERENNYDLAVSLGMGPELYELSVRGRLKDLVAIPEHLMTAPDDGATQAQLLVRKNEVRALEDAVAQAIQDQDAEVATVSLDTWHLQHIVAMLDKAKVEGQNAYFLAKLGMRVRNLLTPTTA